MRPLKDDRQKRVVRKHEYGLSSLGQIYFFIQNNKSKLKDFKGNIKRRGITTESQL